MLLSVVIPAFNEERLLPACLASLPRSDEVEVIVVDNNSTDTTAEIAHAAGAQVVHEPVNQISRARNAGARAASGDWLLFLDADCEMSTGLYADIRSAMHDEQVVAAGCVIAMTGLPWWARRVLAGWNATSRLCRWAAGSLVLCRAQAFRDAGGFSEELYAAEEIDLSRRLKRIGRARGQRLKILHRHPLLSSSRKLQLYSGWELTGQFVRLMTRPWSALRNPQSLALWYDGRRQSSVDRGN
jgi:glycosyltransferase involved in cell wall biosynthesis